MAKKQEYWFKRKLYGWGWYPSAWQGWLTLIIFTILITLNSIHTDFSSKEAQGAALNFIFQTTFLVTVLIAICFLKGETPRWLWGKRKN